MRKIMCGVSVLSLALFMSLTLVGAQGQGPPRPGGPPNPADIAQRRLEFMGQMMDQARIGEAEKTAAMEALKAKNDARTKLQEKLNPLREVSEDQKATDAQITKALNEFITAQVEYNRAVSAADAALVKKISLRTRAKLTVMGIVENGVGFGGGGFGGFGGFGGRGKGGPGGSRGPDGGGRSGPQRDS